MTKTLPENWTDKEFLEDATWLTPHERIEQEEYAEKVNIQVALNRSRMNSDEGVIVRY